MMKPAARRAFRHHLLGWYAQAARPMPWRQTTDPYAIWVSETMLQQTTVAAVVPYYLRFMASFPTVQALAAAPRDAVLHHWQGLGYYRRAHLLHRGAQVVAWELGGVFPITEEGLLALPGIGPYTAAAVTALAYDTPASVLDGNVERVMSRVFAVATPLPAAKPELRTIAAMLADPDHPRAYANAIMELGAVVCTPKHQRCGECPVQGMCAAYAAGNAAEYPYKTPKQKVPVRHGVAVLWQRADGAVWLRQRPAAGLLGGLWEPPNWGWEAHGHAPLELVEYTVVGAVKHTFTHFTLHLEVRRVRAEVEPVGEEGAFYAVNALPPLPTLFVKVLKWLDAPALLV